jgi:hypothetical protein
VKIAELQKKDLLIFSLKVEEPKADHIHHWIENEESKAFHIVSHTCFRNQRKLHVLIAAERGNQKQLGLTIIRPSLTVIYSCFVAPQQK